MRKIYLLVISLLISTTLFAKSYTFFAEDAAGPWGQPDGTGCGNEIVIAAYKAVGVDINLQVMPYIRAKTLVMEGGGLACFGMSWSEELKGKVIFPKTPIYNNLATILSKKEDAKRYRGVRDLKPKTPIGVVIGYEYPQSFVDLVKKGILIPAESQTEVKNIQKITADRIPMMIANLDDLKSADYLIAQADAKGRVQVAFTLEDSGTYLGFAINNPETQEAIKEFDSGMEIIKKNGQLQTIIDRWKVKQQSLH